jgi:stage III sporulation protein SpoIIIAA
MDISTCRDKRIPIIFASSETRSTDLTVPSIGKEQVFAVAKPELKVAVIISGIFSFIY